MTVNSTQCLRCGSGYGGIYSHDTECPKCKASMTTPPTTQGHALAPTVPVEYNAKARKLFGNLTDADRNVIAAFHEVFDEPRLRYMVHATNCHADLLAACEQMVHAVLHLKQPSHSLDQPLRDMNAALDRARGEVSQ